MAGDREAREKLLNLLTAESEVRMCVVVNLVAHVSFSIWYRCHEPHETLAQARTKVEQALAISSQEVAALTESEASMRTELEQEKRNCEVRLEKQQDASKVALNFVRKSDKDKYKRKIEKQKEQLKTLKELMGMTRRSPAGIASPIPEAEEEDEEDAPEVAEDAPASSRQTLDQLRGELRGIIGDGSDLEPFPTLEVDSAAKDAELARILQMALDVEHPGIDEAGIQTMKSFVASGSLPFLQRMLTHAYSIPPLFPPPIVHSHILELVILRQPSYLC